jgi:hypothetical protein
LNVYRHLNSSVNIATNCGSPAPPELDFYRLNELRDFNDSRKKNVFISEFVIFLASVAKRIFNCFPSRAVAATQSVEFVVANVT